jgi:hypothetical protein
VPLKGRHMNDIIFFDIPPLFPSQQYFLRRPEDY